MRPEIKKMIENWSQRQTIPISMAQSAPLLLEARGWLWKYRELMAGAFGETEDLTKRDALRREVDSIEMLGRSIDELLISWKFNSDEIGGAP